MLRTSFVIGLVLATAHCSPGEPQAPAGSPTRTPNFIVIVTDDQGYGDLACAGSETLRTPRLDRMASEGVRFTSFYMAASVCTPSRAALMTGSYAQRVGLPSVLFPNSLPEGQRDGTPIGISPDEITIAEILGDRGYATACVGKWHLGDLPEFLPTRHGFDTYFGLPYSNDMQPANPKKPYPPLPLMRDEQVIETDPDQNLLTRRYTEEAVRFISDHRDRPFFLYVAHAMPHRPLHISDRYLDRFFPVQLEGITDDGSSRDFLYPAVIEELDWSTGAILDALDEAGIAESTLVVFTSDNGPAVGGLGSAGPLRGRKGDMFEGGLRVPCLMRWPGRIPAGSENDEIATAMDLLPTFAGLAGAPIPDDRLIDGRDIWPLMSGADGAHSPHEAFYYFGGNTLWGIRSGGWKLLFERDRAPGDPPGERGPRTGPVLRQGLFDLDADIGESTDLSAARPEVASRLLETAIAFERDLWSTAREVGRAPRQAP
jgi:arylsulfatase A-like enzyme